MKIALIGYGKMGKTIEKLAIERNHEIVSIIDQDNQHDFDSAAFLDTDVAIEFTNPETAVANYLRCFEREIAVVSGTTGWLAELLNIVSLVEQQQKSFLYASNFSIGVNIMFWLNKQLAVLMNKLPGYEAKMLEIHHTQKKDAPSGTAITLAEDIIHKTERLNKWVLDEKKADYELPIKAIREGGVFGYHQVQYESNEDTILLSHNAKSRDGFALGAIMAAEFLYGKKGFFTMDDVLKL
jgi:4-hydroxy-tetrahydrodipicolinate reductase